MKGLEQDTFGDDSSVVLGVDALCVCVCVSLSLSHTHTSTHAHTHTHTHTHTAEQNKCQYMLTQASCVLM